jgi:translation elongation factor EF-4
VVYKDKEVLISNPTDFPEVGDMGIRVKEIQEPVVKASIIVPEGLLFPHACLCHDVLISSHLLRRIFR